MSPGWLREWWPVLALAINCLAAWIMWSARQQFVSRKHCNGCHEKIDDRVSTLEKQKTCVDIKLDKLPQIEALHEIALRQEQLAGQQSSLATELAGVKDLLERIEHPLNLLMEHHLNHRGKP